MIVSLVLLVYCVGVLLGLLGLIEWLVRRIVWSWRRGGWVSSAVRLVRRIAR